ncbi:hypothetical protein [Natrinema caseinilyticum]|uniref:hypothetical protein n=1 Tax=Natrinema caseinilyticum TaxID=2961570 RepID=UPI0020C26744|nr:hypothetical protein [Natrinema caseinilyticum]
MVEAVDAAGVVRGTAYPWTMTFTGAFGLAVHRGLRAKRPGVRRRRIGDVRRTLRPAGEIAGHELVVGDERSDLAELSDGTVRIFLTDHTDSDALSSREIGESAVTDDPNGRFSRNG